MKIVSAALLIHWDQRPVLVADRQEKEKTTTEKVIAYAKAQIPNPESHNRCRS